MRNVPINCSARSGCHKHLHVLKMVQHFRARCVAAALSVLRLFFLLLRLEKREKTLSFFPSLNKTVQTSSSQFCKTWKHVKEQVLLKCPFFFAPSSPFETDLRGWNRMKSEGKVAPSAVASVCHAAAKQWRSVWKSSVVHRGAPTVGTWCWAWEQSRGHRWGQVSRVWPGTWQMLQARGFLAAGGLLAGPSAAVFLPFFPLSPAELKPPKSPETRKHRLL